MRSGRRVAITEQARDEPVALRMAEPASVIRALGEIAQRHEPQQHGGNALEQEQPLPARQSQPAIEPQQPATQRAAEQSGEGNGDEEARHTAGAHGGGKPETEVVDDGRKEARLGDAEQEAQQVELAGGAHEHHRRREDAPADHDARQPDTRSGADEQQVARHLEQRVADEEDAGAESECRGAEAEILVHLQRRETDVAAVEKVEDVEHEHEREDAQAHAPHRLPFERGLALHATMLDGDRRRPRGQSRHAAGAVAKRQSCSLSAPAP